jgi:hypothetical protein
MWKQIHCGQCIDGKYSFIPMNGNLYSQYGWVREIYSSNRKKLKSTKYTEVKEMVSIL